MLTRFAQPCWLGPVPGRLQIKRGAQLGDERNYLPAPRLLVEVSGTFTSNRTGIGPVRTPNQRRGCK